MIISSAAQVTNSCHFCAVDSSSESETKPNTTSKKDALDEPASLPEKEKQPEAGVEAPAPVRPNYKRQKVIIALVFSFFLIYFLE